MLQVKYAKLGEQRGAKRLWLEGKRLADAGFVPGARYRLAIDHDHQRLVLEIADGSRQVSQKTRNGDRVIPVIDIANRDLATVFGEGIERVKVEMAQGCIRITVHPDDAAMLERAERLRTKLQSGAPLQVGSIAHGGGILDHAVHEGLKAAGIDTELAWAIEVEHDYLEAAMANNPVWTDRTVAIEAPMEEVEPAILPRVEIMNAGLPCTGASLSGRSKNRLEFAEQHETAGPLFLAFLQFVRATQPGCLVFENVPSYANTVSFHVIRQVLEKWGYELHETELDGAVMGALEERKRLCVVAVTRGIRFDWGLLAPMRRKEASLGEVLEEIPHDSPRWKTYDYLAEKEERDIAAGKGFRRQLLGPLDTKCGTIGRGYHKSRSTEPFIRHPADPSRSRLLTPAEHARVKTIPAGLVAGLSDTTAHEVLGQSVVHTAFAAVGKLLGQALGAWARATQDIAQAVQAAVVPATDTPSAQISMF